MDHPRRCLEAPLAMTFWSQKVQFVKKPNQIKTAIVQLRRRGLYAARLKNEITHWAEAVLLKYRKGEYMCPSLGFCVWRGFIHSKSKSKSMHHPRGEGGRGYPKSKHSDCTWCGPLARSACPYAARCTCQHTKGCTSTRGRSRPSKASAVLKGGAARSS
jgi:hypothetical protein